MSVYDPCKARREAPVPRSGENVLLRPLQVSRKVNFLLMIMCLKNAIFVSDCSEDTCLVKNGSNMCLGDDGAKELILIYDHIHLSHKNKWTKNCVWSPKGAGPW